MKWWLSVACLLSALALAGCPGVDGPGACTKDSDCFEGYTCDTANGECARPCATTHDCLDSEHCQVAQGASEGFCAFGQAAGGDPAGGD